MSESSNKRITKNTAFLYIRMLLVMCVTLFTSRVVLDALGVDDFGIYNVVGGMASMFIFFYGSLSLCTQRFLNYELGQNDIKGANNVFNVSLLLNTSIAVIVLLAGCTVGRWFVENKLVIPADRMDDAIQVLYATVLSFSTLFIFSVFEAVFIARENMKLYAYLGIIDVILKLGIAYCIIDASNRLALYGWLMFIAQSIPKIIMVIYCSYRYTEARIRPYWNRKLFRSLIGFTGWDTYSTVVWMVNEQGINILINMFFGPAVNAARGIASQVNNAVTNFNTNFFMAVRPQIVKQYAAQEFASMRKLILASTRFSYYLLWVLSLPIILRCDYILSFWLKEVPEYASSFVQWILVYSLINSLDNPIWTGIQATGYLKKAIIYGSNLFLLAFPASYFAIRAGGSPCIVYPIIIAGRLLFLSVSFHYLSGRVGLSISEYLKSSIRPIVIVSLISLISCGIINIYLPEGFIYLICMCLTTLIINATTIYLIGLSPGEKDFIRNKISEYLHKASLDTRYRQ